MTLAIIGLDLGTTSISAVAISQTGRLLKSVTDPHHAAVSSLPENYSEQNPGRIFDCAVQVLQQIAAGLESATVKAIALTGQMHSTVLLDQRQDPIGNVITWQDKRATLPDPQQPQQSLLDTLLSRCPEAAIRNSGCQLSAGYLGTTVFALQRLQQWPGHCVKVSFVADWVAGQLCADAVATDRSHAASSGLVDLKADRWSSPLLKAAEVNPDWLPRVALSGRPLGRLTQLLAQKVGLPAGTLIATAIGDNQAAVLSSLPDDPHSLLINIGTGGQIVWRIPEFVRVAGMDTRYVPSGTSKEEVTQFMLVGAGLCGGNSFAWINQTVRAWLAVFGIKKSEQEVWDVLTRQLQDSACHCCSASATGTEPDSKAGAADPTGAAPTSAAAGELVCEPFFAGTRPEPHRRGVFRGIDQHNFTPANVAASILRGIATSMQQVYQSAGTHRPERVQQIIMSGNASRHNPLLVRAVADEFGVPVSVSPLTEEAATGAAMLAGVRLGVWKTLNEARKRLLQHAE